MSLAIVQHLMTMMKMVLMMMKMIDATNINETF